MCSQRISVRGNGAFCERGFGFASSWAWHWYDLNGCAREFRRVTDVLVAFHAAQVLIAHVVYWSMLWTQYDLFRRFTGTAHAAHVCRVAALWAIPHPLP